MYAEGRRLFAWRQSRAHSLRPLGVAVIIVMQYVGEEKEFQHQKHYGQFDQDQCPQFAAHRHGAETVDVHA